jgi:hypothetical protein
MNPVITQAIAAEKTRDRHAHAAADRRARIAARSRGGARASHERHMVPGLRGRLGRRGASLTCAAGQP